MHVGLFVYTLLYYYENFGTLSFSVTDLVIRSNMNVVNVRTPCFAS